MDSREAIALQNQIYQMRQDLQMLRGQLDRGYGGGGGGGGGEIAAQLLSRVQVMEEQVRQLRGRIDETQNLINRQTADLAKRIDDLTFQLNLQQGKTGSTTPPPLASAQFPTPPPVREVAPRPAPTQGTGPGGNGFGGSGPGGIGQDVTRTADPLKPPRLIVPPPMPVVISPPPPPPSQGPQSFTFNQVPEPMREAASTPPIPRTDPLRPVPRPPIPPAADDNPRPEPVTAAIPLPADGKRTPEMALQEGHAALARRDYAAAERSAREVMANRTSPRAYDGQFLLAQALSGERQFSQAAIAFDDAYNRSHKGRHAQDSLLGLAGALTAINEKKAACDTLGRLRTEFPEVRADLQDSITRTNERAGCSR